MPDETDDRVRAVGGLRGDDSPWAHDVPAAPPPPLPAAWERRVEHDDRPPNPLVGLASPVTPPDAHAGASDHQPLVEHEPVTAGRPRRSLLVVGALALIVVAVLVVRVVGGGGDNGDAAAGGDGTGEVVTESIEPTTPTTMLRRGGDKPPTTIVLEPDGESATPSADSLPEPAPEWTAGPIVLAPRLQSMTVPTQIVVLNTEGVVHVIDVPVGAVRSVDTGLEAPNLAIAVGDSAVVVYSHSYSNEQVTLLNVGTDVQQVDIPGGTSQILARAGTNDFVLASDDWKGNEQPPEILITADGTTSELTSGPTRDYGIWGVRYLPATGEAIVSDSGGVYAIDAAGLARRLSPGALVAVGDNHILARECDEVLTCLYVRINGVSGERIAVTAPDLEQYRGYDSSLSLSPDGTLMAYFDWMGSPLARRVLDFEAGTSAIVDSIDQYNSNTSWAADSSGLFIIENRRLFLYDRATGEHIDAAPDVDLGNIVAVATRPVSS